MEQARDALVQEVTTRQEIQERLEFLVRYDPLTEVLNRRGFFEAAGTCDTARALLIFDVDDFKLVNDRLGHLAGDHVLRAVASALTTAAGPSAAVARLGGDEFVVLLDDLAVAKAIATEPRTFMVELGSGATIAVSASTGMAVLGPGDDIDSAIAAADRLMYASKRDGVQARRPKGVPRPRRGSEPARRLRALTGRSQSDGAYG